MSESAWYIGAAAVRRYLDVTGETLSFDAAAEKLAQMCAEIQRKYQQQPGLEPRLLPSGAHVYRGPSPERLRLMVTPEQEAAGRKPQLVDVLPGHSGFRR
jgi:hypothetical protein